MKPEKTVSLDAYRKVRQGRDRKNGNGAAGICLPSADNLWELLDRNISISVWRVQH